MASSGNFCVLNPLNNVNSATLSEGNLKGTGGGQWTAAYGTFAVPLLGSWYWEVISENVTFAFPGVQTTKTQTNQHNTDFAAVQSGEYRFDGTGEANTSTIGTGDIIAFHVNDGVIKVYVDDVLDHTFGTNMSGGSHAALNGSLMPYYPSVIGSSAMIFNFGQNSSFVGAKTAQGNADANGFGDFFYSPKGLALCSGNIPLSAVSVLSISSGEAIDPAQTDADYPGKQFNVTTWTGNSTDDRAISLDMAPDLVVIKERGAANDWYWYDSNRGASVALFSNLSDDEATDTSELKSFTSTGFTLGTGADTNNNSDTYCGWGWRANGGTTTTDTSGDISTVRQSNTASGFAILTWSGNGSDDQKLPHGLGVKPALVIAKRRDGALSWGVWTQALGANTKELQLGSNGAQQTGGTPWFQAGMTTDFVGIRSHRNPSSSTNVAYVWVDVEGMQKFGTYEGNGNADGPFVYTGFRPRMIFVKDADRAQNWVTFDSARNTFNPVDKGLFYNATSAESTGSGSGFDVDFLSNGFKLRCAHDNMNGSSTYVYGAWGDVPFKYNNTF